jgi:hypothetical protein
MLVLAAMAVLAGPGGAVEHAVYQQRDSEIVARFQSVDAGRDWPSGLAFKMSFSASLGDQWWLVWEGGTAGGHNLASTTAVSAADWRPPGPDSTADRPLGNLVLIVAEADYRIRREPIVRGTSAPAHLLIPDLREGTWYRVAPDQRVRESGQFFDLIRCDGARISKGR